MDSKESLTRDEQNADRMAMAQTQVGNTVGILSPDKASAQEKRVHRRVVMVPDGTLNDPAASRDSAGSGANNVRSTPMAAQAVQLSEEERR